MEFLGLPIDQLVFVAMKRILAGEFYHKLCYDWITESLPLRSTVLNNYMFLFNSYIGFMRGFTFLFYRWESWAIERLSYQSKVTQLKCGKAEDSDPSVSTPNDQLALRSLFKGKEAKKLWRKYTILNIGKKRI